MAAEDQHDRQQDAGRDKLPAAGNRRVGVSHANLGRASLRRQDPIVLHRHAGPRELGATTNDGGVRNNRTQGLRNCLWRVLS